MINNSYDAKIAEHNVKLGYIEKQIEAISCDVKEIKAIMDNYLSFLFSKNKFFICSLFTIGTFFGSVLSDSKIWSLLSSFYSHI